MIVVVANRLKCFIGLAAALSSAWADGQAIYKVKIDGKTAGQATLLQTLTPEGKKIVELSLTIRRGADRIVVKTSTTYDKEGRITHIEQRIYPFGMPAIKESVADITEGGASVHYSVDGKPVNPTIPIDPEQRTENPSVFWFLRDKPALGQVCKVYVFSIDRLLWERCTITYEGKTHKGQLVRLQRAGRSVETAFADDGYPASIVDSGGMEMIRVPVAEAKVKPLR